MNQKSESTVPPPAPPAKVHARATARQVRNRIALAKTEAGDILRDRFLAHVPVADDAVVAGYWPIGTEADLRPLLHTLHEAGAVCALPVVEERDRPLVFRIWEPEVAMVKGPFGLLQPGPEAMAVIPTLLLVPLLAFDRTGHRLGYGAGFYDRTIQALRQTGQVLTSVGVAFAAQEMERVPHGEHDEKLDWILTESYVLDVATGITHV